MKTIPVLIAQPKKIIRNDDNTCNEHCNFLYSRGRITLCLCYKNSYY